jgi:hypothetical protein
MEVPAMGKYINWYLVELERALDGRMNSAAIAETLNEVEAHLEDSASEMAAICRHGQDPEQMAVQQFGSPARVAADITGHPSMKLDWQGAKTPVIWICATGLWLALTAPAVPIMFGVILGAAGFCYAVSKAGRMTPGALAVAVAATVLLGVPLYALKQAGTSNVLLSHPNSTSAWADAPPDVRSGRLMPRPETSVRQVRATGRSAPAPAINDYSSSLDIPDASPQPTYFIYQRGFWEEAINSLTPAVLLGAFSWLVLVFLNALVVGLTNKGGLRWLSKAISTR